MPETVREQFEKVVVSELPLFRARAQRFLGNAEDAEDVVQEALLKAHSKLHQFRGDAKLSSWIHSIVTTESLMHLRPFKRRSSPHVSLDDEAQSNPWGNTLADDRPTPETIAIEAERDARIQDCVRQLAPWQQETFELRYIQELTAREIGRIQGRPTGTIKARLSRMHARLRELMEAKN